MSKPILALDFDGTLNSFTSGYTSPTEVPDAPVVGAREFCGKALEYFEVVVTGPRTNHAAGVDAIRHWLQKHNFPEEIFITEEGDIPPSFLTLSARAQTFTGKFPDEPKKLLAFRPWFKKGGQIVQRNPTWQALKATYDGAMEALLEEGRVDGELILEILSDILRETE